MTSYNQWVTEPRPDEHIFGTEWKRVPNSWSTAIIHAAQDKTDFKDFADATYAILNSQYRLEHPDE